MHQTTNKNDSQLKTLYTSTVNSINTTKSNKLIIAKYEQSLSVIQLKTTTTTNSNNLSKSIQECILKHLKSTRLKPNL